MAERNMVNLTITLTREERKALGPCAWGEEMAVSALLGVWVNG